MNKNTRNLIITIIACTLVLVYINLVNINKKEMAGANNPTASAPGIDPRFNFDALYTCMQTTKKMVNSQGTLVEIKGQLDNCEQELNYLMAKKIIGPLPSQMNLSLTYKALVNDKLTEIVPVDKDGIHVLLTRQEKISPYHCSSNISDLNFTDHTVSFIPGAHQVFIICFDAGTNTSAAYYSADWSPGDIKKTLDQELVEIKKTQANIPTSPAGVDTTHMTPMGTGQVSGGDNSKAQ
jgi:hypothetical protein